MNSLQFLMKRHTDIIPAEATITLYSLLPKGKIIITMVATRNL
jgi:hypothetical protein